MHKARPRLRKTQPESRDGGWVGVVGTMRSLVDGQRELNGLELQRLAG